MLFWLLLGGRHAQSGANGTPPAFPPQKAPDPMHRRSLHSHRLYAECIWPETVQRLLDEADANELPPDLADDVEYYIDINFKFLYAIVQGKHFDVEDIPEELVTLSLRD